MERSRADHQTWTAFLRKDEYSEIGYCKLVQSNICGSFSYIDSHPKKKFIDHSFTTKYDCLLLKKNDHYLPRKRKRYKKEPFKLYRAHHGNSSRRLGCNPREQEAPVSGPHRNHIVGSVLHNVQHPLAVYICKHLRAV